MRSAFMGGIDSGHTERGYPGTGLSFFHRDYGQEACSYTMEDGKPCGCVFQRLTHNQKSCERHGRTGKNFHTSADLRKRKAVAK